MAANACKTLRAETPAGYPPEVARWLWVFADTRRRTLEVLEGQRPVVDVRVAAVVRTYVGTAAYMEVGAMNRLLREGPVVSGAFLDVDPRAEGALYTTLKETPAVASVTLKRAALDSFQDTIAENILRMRLFNLMFASVIAFGVTVPSSPGFFGVIQVAFRLSLVPYGVGATDAVAASVYYQLTQWVTITLVGLYFLQRTGLKLGQLERAAEETEAEAERELPGMPAEGR